MDYINSTGQRVFQARQPIGNQHVLIWLYFKEVHCEDAGSYTCESSLAGHDYVAKAHTELKCKLHNYCACVLFYFLGICTYKSVDFYLLNTSSLALSSRNVTHGCFF